MWPQVTQNSKMAHQAFALATVVSCLTSTVAANTLLGRQNSLSPAANESLPDGWSYIGCYSDGDPRVLNGHGYANATGMTGAMCTAYCNRLKFVYGATEYSDECYCGNYLANSTSLQKDSQCAMSCAGNSSEVCGGPNLLTVYYANRPAPAGPSTNPGPPGWKSGGCWTDSNDRTLKNRVDTPGGTSEATVALCTSACANGGYSLAGVEYAGECYCDNFLAKTGVKADDSDCNMPCNGNSSEFCGAGNRLNLYSSGSTAPSTRPISKAPAKPVNWVSPDGLSVLQFNGWTTQGCYTDNTARRTLRFGQGVPGGGQNMTIEACTSVCQGLKYTFAGVEYAAECFCDNKISNGGGPAPDGDAQCNMPCSGNKDQICGGPDRLNVFSFNNTDVPTTTIRTATGTGTATATGTSDYAGCYTDTNATGRSVSNRQPDDPNMTIESCISVCSSQGFRVAGMQFARECYCDNFLRNSPSLVDDDECNMPCVGNENEDCGAGGRNSVYTNGTIADFIPPSFLPDSQLPTNWTYSGCLADLVNNERSLPYFMEFDNDNSNGKCIETCQKFGFTVAATEYAVQCYCGDAQNYLDVGAQFIANSSCNIRCSNDTAGSNGGEICGGQNALSVYTWKTPFDQWSFASGSAAGRFENAMRGQIVPLITAPARNGKVMFIEKFGTSLVAGSTGAYELDVSTGSFRTLHVDTDVFCAASITLPDRAGRQLNVGGWSLPSTKGVRLYTPDGSPGNASTNDWEEDVNNLALLEGRWYPSAMILANGSVLIAGGEEGSNGAPVPSLEILPQTGNLVDAPYLERTDPDNLYPFLIVLPSGNIFIGYYNEGLLLDPVSLQPVRQLPNMPGSVNRPDSGRTYPYEGTAVVLPQVAPYTDPLEILICGGSNPGVAIALDNCITIEPDNPASNWTIERMPSKRVMTYMAALPDGTYWITGGAHQGVAGFGLATDPNLSSVLYDPSKPKGQRMTVMANTTIARLYHSEATLLDDGRVMVSGSDPQDTRFPEEYQIEYYYPPYLTSGAPRPQFTTQDQDWDYGSSHTLSVSSSGSGGTMRATAMGAVASTHGNSMGQRTFFLDTSCSGGTCTVIAPPNANICPPGWFQIFLLDGDNTPSTASWVRIGGDPSRLGDWPPGNQFTRPGMGAPEKLF
ncbi:hypothetical protein CERZMDRAFT_70063 [Cercospora zeae-maydis SCOH1-5]|uniref:WSC domain-containing protein n=1 Tax=Cercospora zeae-maydis SCOH1-5 TaxID=717836 RepID=A0A6A6F6Z3_9PEZI|nr:hypothetical protein CERZMDRAFT_70063 [Cercospora zeae-maydis SCOH1-5]